MTAFLLLLSLLLAAASSAAVGTAYVQVLTRPGMLLDWWARLLYKAKDWYVGTTPKDYWEGDVTPEQGQVFATRDQRAEWLLKPILTCHLCVSGQVGFWLFLYLQYAYCEQVSIVLSLVCAGVAVYLANREAK